MRIVILLLFAGPVFGQYNPVITTSWGAVTTQEDGTIIDSIDIAYVIYESDSSVSMCETQSLSCEFDVAWGQCLTLHATAKQLSTGLESIPSNTVHACGGDRPNFRLSAPILTATVGTQTDATSGEQ